MKKYLTKILLAAAIGVITISPVHSYAFWGFGDIALDPIQDESGIATQISQVTQVVNQVQMVLKEFGLDVVIYKASQKMSQKLLTKVLNKANGGADGEGSKLFVENFGKYFEDISKQQLGAYTDELSNSSSPFAQSIVMGISNHAGGDTSARSLLEQFTLDKAVPDGVDWKDVGNDISLAGSKGWDFYGQLAMPQNSPLGAGIIAQEELANKINAAKETAKTELTSSGFKPAKEISKYQSLFSSFGSGSGTSSGTPSAETGAPTSEGAAAGTSPAADSGTYQEQESFSNVNLDGNITSPAETTGALSSQPASEAFTRLREADSFGKILFGTITQMVTGLIQQGFSKLGSDGAAVSPLYGGPKDVSKILNTRSSSWANSPQQVVDLRNDLDIGIQKTSLEIAAIEKSIGSVKKPLTDKSSFSDGVNTASGTILSLEFCIPGPDSGFDRRLTDYMTAQTKDTQNKASADTDNGTKNAEALVRIRRDVAQATAESKMLIENPFLNLPGTSGMKSVLNDYYKGAKKFRGLIDTMILKRQVLSSLQVLRSEAQAVGTAANNGRPLVLFDSQWDKMSKAQRSDLYRTLTPAITSGFPEFAAPAAAADGSITLSPLPVNKVDTPEDERDLEMKNRVMAEQWDEWEAKVPDASKQKIYARYIGLTQDIGDSASVQKAQVLAQSTDELYQELVDTLSDCKAIRSHLISNPNAKADDASFVETLRSIRVKNSYPGPSILTAAENGIDFAKLNERLVNSETDNTLQVPNLSPTPGAIILSDSAQELFCRLTVYEATYSNQDGFKGKPVTCKGQIVAGSAVQVKQKSNADWYHTNNGEILFLVSDDQ